MTAYILDDPITMDKGRIGTNHYKGEAYFWNHEYRHYLRGPGCPPGVKESAYTTLVLAMRKRVHNEFLRLGLPLDGMSDDHETVIRYHRLITESKLSKEAK